MNKPLMGALAALALSLTACATAPTTTAQGGAQEASEEPPLTGSRLPTRKPPVQVSAPKTDAAGGAKQPATGR